MDEVVLGDMGRRGEGHAVVVYDGCDPAVGCCCCCCAMTLPAWCLQQPYSNLRTLPFVDLESVFAQCRF